jgi:hypothetical protein
MQQSEVMTPAYDFNRHHNDAKFGDMTMEKGNFSAIQAS